MSSTQDLLGMIAALHERLTEAQELAKNAMSAPASSVLAPVPSQRLHMLFQSMQAQGQETIRKVILELERDENSGANVPHPAQLSREAAGLLFRIKDILSRLKGNEEIVALGRGGSDSVFGYYHETVLLADVLLRLFQTLPDNPASQIRLCEGMKSLTSLLEQRTDNIELLLENNLRLQSWSGDLTSLLLTMAQGKLTDINPLFGLAEDIIAGMAQMQIVEFPTVLPRSLHELVAQQSLLVAQMIALAGLEDEFWCQRLLQPVVAALVHDVGMLVNGDENLLEPNLLQEGERAALEKHAGRGKDLLAGIHGVDRWLMEAVGSHHERTNGIGYPAGLRGNQIDPLVGLLAVFDVYVALRSPRPHRGPFDSASAFAEMMRLSRQGYFDPQAMKILELFGPYPPGTMVELSNGCTGVVISLPRPTRQQQTGQPSVLILKDPSNRPLGNQHILDLNWTNDIAIQGQLLGNGKGDAVGLGGKNWALGA